MRTRSSGMAVLSVLAGVWTLLSAPPVRAQRMATTKAGAKGAALAVEKGADSGRVIFDARCAACHGLDGRGGQAPAIGPSSNAASSSDRRLLQVIRDGLPGGMPGFGALLSSTEITTVLQYLRRLQHAGAGAGVSAGGGVGAGGGGASAAGPGGSAGAAGAPFVAGDPALGRALFFGKAACAQCHLAEGQGGFLGPDLTGVRLDATDIRQAIVRPSASPSGVLADVTLRNGQTITGLVRNEDNFSVQVQDERGAFHLIDKAHVASLSRRGQPLMPSDYERRLSSTEIDALVSFIAHLAAPAAGLAAPPAERKPRK
jgi:cytochrome c oxidase cbb3-type subunit III